MSAKNQILLRRSGRDQFGNNGDSASLYRYHETAEDKKLRIQHQKLNDLFVEQYSPAWIALYRGLSKKEIYSKLHPYGKPALATFYKHAREFKNIEEYLCFLLLEDKEKYLSQLGFSSAEVRLALKPFSECGRYGVTYKGVGMIFTPAWR